MGSCTAFDLVSINHNHDAHGIPGAGSTLARRDSFVKHVDNQQRRRRNARTTPAEPSTEAELGMQRSVARLFYVGGRVSHPSVLDTSGTFININPLEGELFKL